MMGKENYSPGTACRRFSVITLAAVFVACCAFAVIVTKPLVLKAADHLYAPLDSWLNVYIHHYLYLVWTGQGIKSLPFLDGVMFYPEHFTLGFTEWMVGNQPLYAVFFLLTKNPILSYNLLLLGALTLNAFCFFLFASSLFADRFSAFIGSFIFGFSPLVIGYIAHLQLVTFWWTPLCFLFLYRYLAQPSLAALAGGLLCALLQLSSSIHLGVFLFVGGFLVFLLHRGPLLILRTLRTTPGAASALFCLFLLAAGALVLPQYLANRNHNVSRDVAENTLYSAQAQSVLAVSPTNFFASWHKLLADNDSSEAPWEKRLYLGFVPMLCALIAVMYCSFVAAPGFVLRKFCYQQTRPISFSCLLLRDMSLLFLLSALFALGPELLVFDKHTGITLPYYFLLEYCPLFRVLRVPARWGLLMLFACAVLSTLAIARLLCILGRTKVIVGFVILAATAAEQLNLPLPLDNAAFSEADYSMIAALSSPPSTGGAVLFWPALDVDSATLSMRITGALENARHAEMCLHFRRPMVNGYSGFEPASYLELVRLGRKLPANEFLRHLRAIGVSTVVFDKHYVTSEHPIVWDDALMTNMFENDRYLVGDFGQ
jgi:hypothetical protein